MEIEWKTTDHVAIAVSGGVDSMVLLDKVRRSGHYQTLTILHVHHGLREESDAEAAMIENYAKQFELPCFIKRVPEDYFSGDKSIQNAAREFRYQFFEAMMVKYDIDCLLTAHHKDDQQETVLFRLLTGRFYAQPVGILDSSKERSYALYRPLLQESKAALYQYATKYGVPYMEDKSNQKTDYVRNVIRHQLLPVINGIDALSADHLTDFADWQLEMLSLVEEKAEKIVEAINANKTYSRSAFSALPRTVQRYVLLTLTHHYAADYHPISHHYLDEIIRVIAEGKAQADYALTDLFHLEIAYDTLYFYEVTQIEEEMTISAPGQYQFNGFMIELIAPITDIIKVRVSKPGDRITINEQHQKISRLFINAKVPKSLRVRMPILTIQGIIIAVGPLKHNDHPANRKIKINFKGES